MTGVQLEWERKTLLSRVHDLHGLFTSASQMKTKQDSLRGFMTFR